MWKKGSFEAEKSEFERYGYDKKNFQILRMKYAGAGLTNLQENIWRQLNNTDSYDCRSFEQLQKIMKLNKAPRDVNRIVEQFKKSVDAPIIILWSEVPNKPQYELVAGNTRLCVARILKQVPKVVIIDMRNI